MKKELFIITNESFYIKDNSFFCDNIDLKSIPEELSKYSEICVIGRKSKKIRTKKLNVASIKIFSNIIFYSLFIIKSLIHKDGNYFIISVSPYTLIASIILKIVPWNHFLTLLFVCLFFWTNKKICRSSESVQISHLSLSLLTPLQQSLSNSSFCCFTQMKWWQVPPPPTLFQTLCQTYSWNYSWNHSYEFPCLEGRGTF